MKSDLPPVAPPQDFIGPRVYPPKFLRCDSCGDWIHVADKYPRASTARHDCCTPEN